MKKSIIAALCGLLTACASPDVAQYQKAEPKLDLVHYFVGKPMLGGCFNNAAARC